MTATSSRVVAVVFFAPLGVVITASPVTSSTTVPRAIFEAFSATVSYSRADFLQTTEVDAREVYILKFACLRKFLAILSIFKS